MINIREGLTFDDVLLVPQKSEIESRANIDISVNFGGLFYNHPIIPANMKTITGEEMAAEIIESGGLAILHRFMPIQEQFAAAKNLVDHYGSEHIAVSIGVKDEEKYNISEFLKLGIRIVCIDVAHGHSKLCFDMVKFINKEFPELFVIAGNVATGAGATMLWEAGAHIVKVGVGPGSLCTTRIETGNGVPQLSALIDVANARKLLQLSNPNVKYTFIADGGIKNSGDIVKALCFADMVMVGNIFAGCEETPGTIMSIDGRSYKEYVGSSTHKTNHIEGVAAIVPAKGKFKVILNKLLEGVRSGCSYQGCANLKELQESPEFIKITNAGLKESHPHDVRVI